MEFLQKKNSVLTWLKDLYGSEKAVDIPDESIEQLYDLKETSEMEERSLEKMAELKEFQMAEFKQEINTMRQRLDALGLSEGHDEIDSIANDLAQSAELLGVDEPSEFSLDLAIADLRRKAAHVPIDAHSRQIDSKENQRAMRKDLILLKKTEEALGMAKTEAKKDAVAISKFKEKFSFADSKYKEYQKLEMALKATIKKNGYSSSSTHETILDLKEQHDKVIEEMKPVSAKLEAYKGLPASLELARAELAEKEEELRELKNRIKVDLQDIPL